MVLLSLRLFPLRVSSSKAETIVILLYPHVSPKRSLSVFLSGFRYASETVCDCLYPLSLDDSFSPSIAFYALISAMRRRLSVIVFIH